jgi:aspartyl protease family protein
LGIEPTGKRKFKLAEGNVKEYATSEAYIEIAGVGVTSLVTFLPTETMPLLGVTTLELLGLKVNPIKGELEPMELLLL